MSNRYPSPEPHQPFRFLDLPREIRLMVYERIPREVKQILLQSNASQGSLVLLKPVTSTSILATCRQVYHEALPVINTTLHKFILEKPPRIIGTLGPTAALNLSGIVSAITRCIKRETVQRSLNDNELESFAVQAFIALSVRQLSFQRTRDSTSALCIEYLYAYDNDHENDYRFLSPADRLAQRSPYILNRKYLTALSVSIALVGQFPTKGCGNLPEKIEYEDLETPRFMFFYDSDDVSVPPVLVEREAWATEWVDELWGFRAEKGPDELV